MLSVDVNDYEGAIQDIIESYKNYPGILEDSDKFSQDVINFKFQKTEISKVRKLINEMNKIDIKKVGGTD